MYYLHPLRLISKASSKRRKTRTGNQKHFGITVLVESPTQDHRQSGHRTGWRRGAQTMRSKCLLDEAGGRTFPCKASSLASPDWDGGRVTPCRSSPTFPDSPGSMDHHWRQCRPPPSRPVPSPPRSTGDLGSRSRGARVGRLSSSKVNSPTTAVQQLLAQIVVSWTSVVLRQRFTAAAS